MKAILLMAVSAFWHGVHPGWYATFMFAPFLLLAESGIEHAVRKNLTTDTQRVFYDRIASVVRMRHFEYFSIGALFLFYDEIWRFWSSVYFYGHLTLITLIVIGPVLSFSMKLIGNKND